MTIEYEPNIFNLKRKFDFQFFIPNNNAVKVYLVLGNFYRSNSVYVSDNVLE